MRPTSRCMVWLAILIGVAPPVYGQSVPDPPGGRVGSERWATDFTRHTVPLEEIISGGPPKDGIPALDDPRFISVEAADEWLSDGDPVAFVRVGGLSKAYPLQILVWHEIVNDRLGGVPVTITFCPLCNTTLAFTRRQGSRTLDFGTTGRLRYSDLVMYDRQTETWWQQATGEAIVGELAGEQLDFVPAPVLSWEEVKEVHPEARVLSRDTGYDRPYGRNPYPGYDRQQNPIREFFSRDSDSRLPAMERVLGLWNEEEAIAVSFAIMSQVAVTEIPFGGRSVVAFWAPGARSALDAETINTGRDVGSTGVFETMHEGRRLSFTPAEDGRFIDRETRSTWTVSGEAVAGTLAGERLTPVVHGNHFWFAWAAFQPSTTLHQP